MEDAKGINNSIITKRALLFMSIAGEPLVVLYTLLPFILRKDLHATPLQISLFVSLKPIVAIFSFYLTSTLAKRGNGISGHLRGAWFLAYIPFLFFPFLDSFWYLLFAASFYQLFSKVVTPMSMELLKQHLPKEPRGRFFSWSFLLCFLESTLLGLLIGSLLDHNPSNWRLFAGGAALIALSSFFIQKKIPVTDSPASILQKTGKSNPLLDPVKESLQLMEQNVEFKQFQWGFMIGGSALMFMAPALPLFYADSLALSHETISTARFLFMAIGVAASSFFWRVFLERRSVNQLMPWVTLGFALFPLLLLLATYQLACLNTAFFVYGVAQAGSHLIWHLSGTIFSKNQDSSPFTALNILLQGVRGLVAPFLGGLICSFFGAVPVLLIGSLGSIYGIFVMCKNNFKNQSKINIDAKL